MAKIRDGFRGSRAIVLPASLVREMEADGFASKLHITDIGYFPSAKHHYMKRGDGAPQYILIYCIGGEGWVELKGRRHAVKTNTFLIIPAHVPHAYGSDDASPWTIYWMHFGGTLAGFYADGFDTPSPIMPNDHSRITDRINIFEEIYRILENGFSRDNIYYAISSLYYFLGSLKYIGKFRESGTRHNRDREMVERVIMYMRENIESKLTLDQLSQYARCSASYLNTAFRHQTGYPPLTYLTHMKVQAACNMLDFSPMKINQICYKIGIGDPYYFSKVFTKVAGVSPTEYRNRKKG